MNGTQALDSFATVVLAADEHQLFKSFMMAARALECDQALFGMQVHLPTQGLRQHVASGYREDFQRLYQERQFIAQDPTVAHCQVSTELQIWNDSMWPAGSEELLEESKRHGLGYGVSLGVHQSAGCKSMVSLARDQPFALGSPEEQRIRTGVAVLASCMHVATQRLIVPRLFEAPTLNDREKSCLLWVANGKSDGMIADIFGDLSPAGVKYHVAKAMAKLGVATRLQAVAKAVELQLLY
ncbi:MAG: LuxR family transcriptional regulator [Ramlibacter sp.]|jgi:DNA-binding CsgD family transcriptional regulator|nr:LuxR family transcriptional regulator [Ramlibacter sp.]